MAVFEYTAMAIGREGHVETGRIVANDKLDAFDKMKRRNLKLVSLRKVQGFSAFIAKFVAEIK